MLLEIFYFIIDIWGYVFSFMLSIELWPGMNLLVFNLSLLVIPLIIKFCKLSFNEYVGSVESDVSFLRSKKRQENYQHNFNMNNINNAKHSYQPKHSFSSNYGKHAKRY